jgi:hypothetical protein
VAEVPVKSTFLAILARILHGRIGQCAATINLAG